jgi:hypothetical protein
MEKSKRVWVAGLAGMGLGFLVELITGFFTQSGVNGILMLFIIAAGWITSYFVLKNNKDFGRK